MHRVQAGAARNRGRVTQGDVTEGTKRVHESRVCELHARADRSPDKYSLLLFSPLSLQFSFRFLLQILLFLGLAPPPLPWLGLVNEIIA